MLKQYMYTSKNIEKENDNKRTMLKTKNREQKMVTKEVPPRFELRLLDSESNVQTARPWNQLLVDGSINFYLTKAILS